MTGTGEGVVDEKESGEGSLRIVEHRVLSELGGLRRELSGLHAAMLSGQEILREIRDALESGIGSPKSDLTMAAGMLERLAVALEAQVLVHAALKFDIGRGTQAVNALNAIDRWRR